MSRREGSPLSIPEPAGAVGRDDKIDPPTAATRAAELARPLRHRDIGAVTLRLLGGVEIGGVAAILAPDVSKRCALAVALASADAFAYLLSPTTVMPPAQGTNPRSSASWPLTDKRKAASEQQRNYHVCDFSRAVRQIHLRAAGRKKRSDQRKNRQPDGRMTVESFKRENRIEDDGFKSIPILMQVDGRHIRI